MDADNEPNVVATSARSTSQRLRSALAAVGLLVFAAIAAAYLAFYWETFRIPAGNGWVGGHYWRNSWSQVVIGLAFLTLIAALSATSAAKAVTLLYSAVTGRPTRPRLALIAGALTAGVVVAVAVATPEELCPKKPCPVEESTFDMS